MTSYLASGWFQTDGKKGLRTEVIDGAMDVAGMLARADVPAHVLMRVALRVRALVAIADPQMVGISRFSEAERSHIMNRVERYTDTSPELHAFVADCLERVDNVSDMMAFYLHLIHVARMMQLIDVALHDTLMEQVRGAMAGPTEPTVDTPPSKKSRAKTRRKTTKTKGKKAASPRAKKTKVAPTKKRSTKKKPPASKKKAVAAKKKSTAGKKTKAQTPARKKGTKTKAATKSSKKKPRKAH